MHLINKNDIHSWLKQVYFTYWDYVIDWFDYIKRNSFDDILIVFFDLIVVFTLSVG